MATWEDVSPNRDLTNSAMASSVAPSQCSPGVKSCATRLLRFQHLPEPSIRHLREDLPQHRACPTYCSVLATLENALLAFEPINLSVPTTITRITANMTAYSAMRLERPCGFHKILLRMSRRRSIARPFVAGGAGEGEPSWMVHCEKNTL